MLEDVGRLVALNGFTEECKRLPFLCRSLQREEDLLVALKHVRYGRAKRTLLMSRARYGDVHGVRALLKAGADVNATDAHGETALTTALEYAPLHTKADGKGRVEEVVRLLLDSGADSRGGMDPDTMFGCGGDRDRKKRPLMGEIASRYSDFSVVTSDNPRSENPETIIREIESGMTGTNRIAISDRAAAIHQTIAASRAGSSKPCRSPATAAPCYRLTPPPSRRPAPPDTPIACLPRRARPGACHSNTGCRNIRRSRDAWATNRVGRGRGGA